MNRKYLKYFSIFIILLLGSVSVSWSNSHFLLAAGDFSFPTNKIYEFQRMLYSWDPTSLGFLNFMILGFSLPYGIYLAITHLVNLSSVHSQIFWNYLLFSSLGLSMYFLVIQVIDHRIKYATGLLSALFFMFNPWGASGITMFIPYITFIPLILGLYIRGLNKNMGIKYLISISVIWYFISSFSIWNIRGFIFQWIILFFYFLLFCLQNRNKVQKAILFTVTLIFLYVLLNSAWLILFILNITKSLSESSINYFNINYTRLNSFTINSSSITLALRMLDNWSTTANFKGVYYFPWLSYYLHPLLIFLGFTPLLTALASIFYVMRNGLKQYSHVIFFFALMLFGFFISMGQNNPLTLWLAYNLPLFSTLFTLPSFHGGVFIAIGFSVLIGYGFMFMSQRIKSFRLQIVLFLLCLAAIMTYGYPIWSGQFIPAGNKVLGAGRYQLPSYELDLIEKISQEKLNYRIFSFPFSKLSYFSYTWPPLGFNGPDPLLNILSKSQVIGLGIGARIADTTTKNIDKTFFFKLASLLNVKYIMNKRDANLLHIKNNSWYTVPDQTFLNSLYQNNADVSSFGQIDLIKIPDELFLPKLYTPLKIIHASNVSELPNIVSQKDYQTRSAIYFEDKNSVIANTFTLSEAKGGNLMNKKTILEYRMISPVKYRVKVHNAQGAFPLVMSESFHEGWKLYSSSVKNYQLSTINYQLDTIQGTIQNDSLSAGPINETWFKKPIIDDKNHLMVNGYANSWIIDTNKICNDSEIATSPTAPRNDTLSCIKNADGSYDFELVIEFWPQRLYYLGLAISLTTLISCLSYLSWTWIKKKNKRIN